MLPFGTDSRATRISIGDRAGHESESLREGALPHDLESSEDGERSGQFESQSSRFNESLGLGESSGDECSGFDESKEFETPKEFGSARDFESRKIESRKNGNTMTSKSDSIATTSNAESRARSAEIALYGVYEISKLLTAPARLEITCTKVLRLLSSFLDMRHGMIVLLDNERTPELVVDIDGEVGALERLSEVVPDRVFGRIVVTQMPIVIESIRDEPMFENLAITRELPADIDSCFLGVPIKDRGKVVGTLTIDRERTGDGTGHRTDDDIRFLTMVANLIGQTVRLQRFVARDREQLLEDRRKLEKLLGSNELDPSQGPAGIVGKSNALHRVLAKVRIVARSHSTVLLRGESGTGKELFAQALHELSPRRSQPFVTLNCAALPETVLESELFGHEKGAFTGAVATRKGRFELADGGTLFLDEIGEISAAFQAKLLRVLQIGEFERVGGAGTIKVDVRIVAATNRNLEAAVARGEFRSDLYYRISVVPILLPPLRERREDIPLLASEFVSRFNRENGTELALTESALSVLGSCSFPGNVRELENCIRRTATLASGPRVVANDFACRHDECLSSVLWKDPHGDLVTLRSNRERQRSVSPAPFAPTWPGVGADDELEEDDDELGDFEPEPSERERLISAMEQAGWVQAKAARMLGLTPRQIGYALRKYAVPIKKF